MSVMHMGTTLHQFGCMTNRQSLRMRRKILSLKKMMIKFVTLTMTIHCKKWGVIRAPGCQISVCHTDTWVFPQHSNVKMTPIGC